MARKHAVRVDSTTYRNHPPYTLPLPVPMTHQSASRAAHQPVSNTLPHLPAMKPSQHPARKCTHNTQKAVSWPSSQQPASLKLPYASCCGLNGLSRDIPNPRTQNAFDPLSHVPHCYARGRNVVKVDIKFGRQNRSAMPRNRKHLKHTQSAVHRHHRSQGMHAHQSAISTEVPSSSPKPVSNHVRSRCLHPPI